jgi:hypothetical protein
MKTFQELADEAFRDLLQIRTADRSEGGVAAGEHGGAVSGRRRPRL